jgi:hypothetical protein
MCCVSCCTVNRAVADGPIMAAAVYLACTLLDARLLMLALELSSVTVTSELKEARCGAVSISTCGCTANRS